MKNKTTWIVLSVATLGVAGVVYYNWDWIQKNLLGKATLSKSHGTTMGIVELDEVQTGSTNTDANNIEETGASQTNQTSYDDDGNAYQDTSIVQANSLVFPSYDTDVQVKGASVGVQVHKVDSGVYQFIPQQYNNFQGMDTDLTIIDAINVNYKFGANVDYIGPYLMNEAPIGSFPASGIYPIEVNFGVGNSEEGVVAVNILKFDLQVIL